MSPRRPPDILRKSHAHTQGKDRARRRRDLERELEGAAGTDSVTGLLIDLDGVIYRGDEPINGAAGTIAWLAANDIPHLFVTNTTSRPRAALVEKLAAFGVAVRAEEILTPPDAAAAWLTAHDSRRILLLVPEATASAFADFEILEGDAAIGRVDAVVVGDLGREFTFDRLNAAFRCLMATPRPELLALGMTRYWRAPEGLRLDTAPFVVALSHASGVEPRVLGKPARAFFDAALARLGLPAARTLMIGDDIRADIAGAAAAGLRGILVRTGKFRSDDLGQDVTPGFVIDSIADLPRIWPECASV